VFDLSDIEVVRLDEHEGKWRRFELRPNSFPVAICCTPAMIRLTNRSGFEALAECAVRTLPFPPMVRIDLEVHISTPTDNHHRGVYSTMVRTDASAAVHINTWYVLTESRRRAGKRGNGPWKTGPASFRLDLFIPGKV